MSRADATTYRGRAVIKSEISPIEEDILSLLVGGELYGLQICDAYEEVSSGERRMSVGTLYPVLSRLEGKKFVESRREGARRKYFRITPSGSRALLKARSFREKLENWKPR